MYKYKLIVNRSEDNRQLIDLNIDVEPNATFDTWCASLKFEGETRLTKFSVNPDIAALTLLMEIFTNNTIQKEFRDEFIKMLK